MREIHALVRQLGNCDTAVYDRLLQFWFTPLYNLLRELQGKEDVNDGDEDSAYPWDNIRIQRNDEILKAAFDSQQFSCYFVTLTYLAGVKVMTGDMESAKKYGDLKYEQFLVGTLLIIICALTVCQIIQLKCKLFP